MWVESQRQRFSYVLMNLFGWIKVWGETNHFLFICLKNRTQVSSTYICLFYIIMNPSWFLLCPLKILLNISSWKNDCTWLCCRYRFFGIPLLWNGYVHLKQLFCVSFGKSWKLIQKSYMIQYFSNKMPHNATL